MGGVITAVVTEDARKFWPQYLGGQLDRFFFSLLSFKVGEGGWVTVGGGGKAPRTPDATLRLLSAPLIQEIDAIVDPTRAAADQRYPGTGASYSRAFFEKALTPSDITFVPPSTIRCRCFLDLPEFNDDGFGNNPELWEIGVYGPLQGGDSAAISTFVNPNATVTGLSGMVVGDVGGTLTITNSANPANNGTFPINTFISDTSVIITNASGAVDAGPLHWACSTRKLMIAYGTYPLVVKTAGRQDENLVEITF